MENVKNISKLHLPIEICKKPGIMVFDRDWTSRERRMNMTNNASILKWVEEKKNWLQPDQVMWIDGSEAQLNALRAEACSTGELVKLNEENVILR